KIIPESGLDLKAEVDKFETALIIDALDQSKWVKNKAAALLRLNRTTLVEKLKKKKIFGKISGYVKSNEQTVQ
ncbi:MAG: helix-turn-helix domain-containing protein, partial [Nitrospinota bacterium]